MASYQFDGVCYTSPESTLSAMASTMTGVGTDANGSPVPYHTVVEELSLKTISTNGTVQVMSPQLQPCQLLDWPQTTAICLLIALIWGCAWGYRTLQRTMDMESDQ